MIIFIPIFLSLIFYLQFFYFSIFLFFYFSVFLFFYFSIFLFFYFSIFLFFYFSIFLFFNIYFLHFFPFRPVPTLSDQMSAKGIKAVYEIGGDVPPVVMGDKTRLNHVRKILFFVPNWWDMYNFSVVFCFVLFCFVLFCFVLFGSVLFCSVSNYSWHCPLTFF